ncbi:MAG: hypothetical protein GEV06_02330 [Luteitalea sp.]|nr:hypothetical protein [Luteitalea sp.]
MSIWSRALLGRGGQIALILALFLVGPGGPLTLIHPVGPVAPSSARELVVCDTAHHTPPTGHTPTGCAICHALYVLRWQPTVRSFNFVVDSTPKLLFWSGDVRPEYHRPDAPGPSRAPPVRG